MFTFMAPTASLMAIQISAFRARVASRYKMPTAVWQRSERSWALWGLCS